MSARNRQRQQAERQMAKLRSEAVQARRLAEHIENLSRETATYKHKRKHAMTETTIVDPGHAQRLRRRAQDKPAASGNQMNFNPLHPSMELPPEQLIRLLGMESKKIRKSGKTRRRAARQVTSAEQPPVDTQESSTPDATQVKPAMQVPRPADRNIQYERCEAPQVFDNGRSGLLMPALLAGVVVGIAVSGYLFWYQPAGVDIQKTPAPVAASQPQKTQPKRKAVERSATPVAALGTAAKKSTAPKMSVQERAEWQAAVEAREQHLLNAAQQRLAERVSQLQASPAAETNEPVVEEAPVAPVMATEPATTAAETVTNAVAPTDTPADAPVQEPVQLYPETDPAIVDTALVPPAAVEATEETAPASEAMQADTDKAAATLPEPVIATPAPVETTPESDATESNGTLYDEPDTAASVDAGIEPAPVEAAPALPEAPTDGLSAVTADDTLF
ncbi:MAG: hypothetical protein ACE5FQ_08425 [Thiogranum sp.]